MTTENSIDLQISKDYKRFYDAVYDGKLPDDLVERFKRVILALAPGEHKARMDICKGIISKKPYDLTNLDVGIIINLAFSAPLEKVYPTLTAEEAVDANIELETIRDGYNNTVNQMQEVLSKKKERLMQLSGVGGNSVPFKKPILVT